MARAGGARKFTLLLVVIAVAGALAGCGGTSLLIGHRSATCAHDADGPAAPAAQVAVVCGWATALQAGRIQDAAGYFHLPSVFYDETAVVTVRTQKQAELVNSTLTCGAKPISAYRQGRYVNVLFRLTSRRGPGGGTAACGSGIGEPARTRFLIRDGKILAWLRAPTTASSSGGGSGSGSGSGSTV